MSVIQKANHCHIFYNQGFFVVVVVVFFFGYFFVSHKPSLSGLLSYGDNFFLLLSASG